VQAGFAPPSLVASVIFCITLKKGHDHLTSRGVLAGPIRDGVDVQFFEIRDNEGNLITEFALSITMDESGKHRAYSDRKFRVVLYSTSHSQ